LLQSSELRRIYRDWLAEWRNQFQNAHAVEAQLAAHVRTVNDLCRQAGAQPWLAPPVPVWPAAPQDRATLFCAQVYAQQQHFLDGFGAFASRARAATRPFGPDPEQTLAGLWSLTRTAGVERRQTTETLGKLDSALGALERWVANNRQRFLPVTEAERGVQAYEPQIAGYVDAVWTSLRARVESVPLEALRVAAPKGGAAVGLIDEAVALRARIRAQGQGATDIAAWRAAVDAADLGRLFGRLGDVHAALQQPGGEGTGGPP
jgi:hypothetical protein